MSIGAYEAIPAGSTDEEAGWNGAAGDRLDGLLVIPATTSPGAVSIKDGDGASITVFAGGADSIATLHPFFVSFGQGIIARAGAWQITTGADVSVLPVGQLS